MLLEAERAVMFAIPIVIVYVIVRLLLIKYIRYEMGNDLLRLAFICYLAILVYIVWIYGALHVDYLLYNFVPFKTIVGYLNYKIPSIAVKNLIGNIVITLPLGLFAAVGFRLPRLHIIAYSIGTSIIIETAQFILFRFGLGMRTIDIDDVLLNTCGTLIGYYLASLVLPRIFQSHAESRKAASRRISK